MGDRVRELPRTILRSFPAEQAVDDVHLRVQIGDTFQVRIALHVLE